MLEEVVEVAVQEIKALQGINDLFAFAALAAVDGFNDHIGGDDVAVAGGGAGDFVGADVEVLFSEEGSEGHGLVVVGSLPFHNYGVYPGLLSTPKRKPPLSQGLPRPTQVNLNHPSDRTQRLPDFSFSWLSAQETIWQHPAGDFAGGVNIT